MQSGTNVSSNLVGSLILKNGTATYSSATYGYDTLGNITSITATINGTAQNRSYTYDTLGQMTQEVIGSTTYNYTYDTYGNIRSKTTTSGTNANFTYGTSGWLDKLLSYNGNSISYDAIGNPTVWHDGSTFTWTNGKQLTAATAADGTVLSYSYDADGLRLTKVVDGVTHNYLWQGDRLVSEQYGTTELEFFYDESGVPYAFDYNGTIYYYITNLQGDVIGIVDASGVSKATYKYNAWGEDIDTTAVVSDIETINPLRYRGYFFDHESGFYYLQSRYYSPEVGRFINADEFASTGQGFVGYNMFAYCGNNPINRIDVRGTTWMGADFSFDAAKQAAKQFAESVFGAGSSTTEITASNEVVVLGLPFPVTIVNGIEVSETVSEHGDTSKPISVFANKEATAPIRSSSAGMRIMIGKWGAELNLALDDIGIYIIHKNGEITNNYGATINLSKLKIGYEYRNSTIESDGVTVTNYENYSFNPMALLYAYAYVMYGQPMPMPTPNGA